MKKSVVILIAALVFFQILTFIQVDNLHRELQNTRQLLNNAINRQSGQIDGIYGRIESLLNTEASIIDSQDYALGPLDPSSLTVPVTFSVTPKKLTTSTQATLQIADTSVPMIRHGGTFKATVSADLFKPLQPVIMLTDGSEQRIEQLPVQDNLRQRLLPSVYVMLEAGGSGYTRKSGDAIGEYLQSGRLRVEVKPVVGNTLMSARLLTEIDGKAVSEKQVNINMSTELNERIPLAAGQELTMTLIATDQFGLSYRSTIDRFTLDADANPAHQDGWFSPEATIIGRNGQVVWSPQS